MRIRLCIFALFLACALPLSAQEADSIAGVYMNKGEWFGLQRVYEADSSRMSPFMRAFSKVMLSHFFHRPQQAIDDTKRLLKLHENEVGDMLLLPLMQLLAKDYSALRNNSEAKNVMDKLIWLFEKHSSEKVLASLKPSRDIYEALSHFDLYKLPTVRKVYNAPFELREVGDSAQSLVFIKGQLGSKKADFVFDTGSAYNVITPDLVDAYGLKDRKSVV